MRNVCSAAIDAILIAGTILLWVECDVVAMS